MPELPIPEAALDQHLIVLGKTRAGKSSAMRLMVETLLDRQKPVAIVDPKGDWWGLKSSASGKSAGYPVVIFGGEHADVPLNEHSGAAVAELVATGNRPCVIDLGGWTVKARTRFFIDFAGTLFRKTRGPRWLVIDEVHNVAPESKGGLVRDPQVGMMLHWANRLITEGGGKGLTVISASQRPQKVAKDFVTSNETLVAMRVIHPLDRNAMKEWIDGAADKTKGREVLDTLADMARGEGWVWSPEIGFGPARIRFPKFRTYDSFAAPTGEAAPALKGWASVDLEDVKAKLAAAVEEAKANDPKLLRARIAELEAAARKPAAGPAIKRVVEREVADPKAVRTAEERGAARERKRLIAEAKRAERDAYFTGVKHGAIAVRDLATQLLEEAPRDLVKRVERFRGRVGHKGSGAEFASTLAIDADALTYKSTDPKPASVNPDSRTSPVAGGFDLTRVRRRPDDHGPSGQAGRRSGAGDGVSGPEQRILDALATWKAMGHEAPSNAQVAWLARYSPSSTSYTNPRGALKTRGLIDYPAPGTLALTVEGEATAFAVTLNGSLLDFVLSQLPGPEARILRAAAELHPEAGSNDMVASAAGYSASSTSYTNPRGALKTKELIDYPAPGMVRAAAWLFAGAR